tara:strand:+ start:5246 stop:5557 length:312 start_codon:yes stop_codon:yes gene_type:complete
MTEFAISITVASIAGVSTGTLSVALILHLLKSKLSVDRYEGETKLFQDAIHEKIDSGYEIARERHTDIKRELYLLRKANAVTLDKGKWSNEEIDKIVEELNGD